MSQQAARLVQRGCRAVVSAGLPPPSAEEIADVRRQILPIGAEHNGANNEVANPNRIFQDGVVSAAERLAARPAFANAAMQELKNEPGLQPFLARLHALSEEDGSWIAFEQDAPGMHSRSSSLNSLNSLGSLSDDTFDDDFTPIGSRSMTPEPGFDFDYDAAFDRDGLPHPSALDRSTPGLHMPRSHSHSTGRSFSRSNSTPNLNRSFQEPDLKQSEADAKLPNADANLQSAPSTPSRPSQEPGARLEQEEVKISAPFSAGASASTVSIEPATTQIEGQFNPLPSSQAPPSQDQATSQPRSSQQTPSSSQSPQPVAARFIHWLRTLIPWSDVHKKSARAPSSSAAAPSQPSANVNAQRSAPVGEPEVNEGEVREMKQEMNEMKVDEVKVDEVKVDSVPAQPNFAVPEPAPVEGSRRRVHRRQREGKKSWSTATKVVIGVATVIVALVFVRRVSPETFTWIAKRLRRAF